MSRERFLRFVEERWKAMGFASERAACLRAGIGADGLRTVRKGSMPKLEKLAKLAPVLGVSLDALMASLGIAAASETPALGPTPPPPDPGRPMSAAELRETALLEIQAALVQGRKDLAALLAEAFLHDLLADIARDKARADLPPTAQEGRAPS